MLHFSLVEMRCPHCGNFVDSFIMGICSWLGPPVYLCDRCGKPFPSRRAEWADMKFRRKAWYVGVSLLYVAAGGGMGGLSVAACADFLRHGPWKKEMTIGTLEQWLGTLGYALLIAVTQVARVLRSRERTRQWELKALESAYLSTRGDEPVEEPPRHNFWLTPFILTSVAIFGPGLVGWLIALVLG